MIKLIETVTEMRLAASLAHKLSQRIAFVPTLGALHRGHESLLREARRHGDLLVLSIFVNPTQFGPTEDLSRYPRPLEADLERARAAGVDLVFHPTSDEIYPAGYQTFVEVRELQKGLCGTSRPGHFAGVATVVLKLFHIVQPHVAFFGEKDYQQLQLIRRLVRDLELPVKIVGMPIIREPDGLALSSRNAYLAPDERQQALALSRALARTREQFSHGERDAHQLLATARAVIAESPSVRLDYLELVDAETLAPVETTLTQSAVLAVAAFVGKTRLIDNISLRA